MLHESRSLHQQHRQQRGYPCGHSGYDPSEHADEDPYLVALLTLDMVAVEQWAKKTGLPTPSGTTGVEKIAEDPAFSRYLNDRVAEVNRQLAHFATVKRFMVVKPDFTVENGLLTPTQKIRRRNIYATYQHETDELYRPATERTHV